MVSVSVHYLFYQPMDEKIKIWTLRFPAKENPNMERASFDWPMVLRHDVKAKCRLISRKFSGMTSFFTRAFAKPIKSHKRLYPFDRPIILLYFRSFVVSVLFARFHFKVIRKSLFASTHHQKRDFSHSVVSSVGFRDENFLVKENLLK